MEKASSQPNQAIVVTEGLLAASILVRLSLADVQAGNLLGSLLTLRAGECRSIKQK